MTDQSTILRDELNRQEDITPHGVVKKQTNPRWVQSIKSELTTFVFFLLKLAIIGVFILFLYHYITRTRFSPTNLLPSSTFIHTLADFDSAPSYYTSDGKPLPGFPITDELRTIKAGDILADQPDFVVGLVLIESSGDGRYEEEQWVAVLQRTMRNADALSTVSNFFDHERKVYAHQVIKIFNDYWFIHSIGQEELLMARLVNSEDATLFPVVWEV